MLFNVMHHHLRVAQQHNWLGIGLVIKTSIKMSHVQLPVEAQLHNNSVQVVHTLVHMSPSSIIWYWSMDGETLQLGR